MKTNNSKEALVVKALEFHKVKLESCLSCVFDLKGAYELGLNEYSRIESDIKNLRAKRIDAALTDLGLNKGFYGLTQGECIEPEAFVRQVAELLPDLTDKEIKQKEAKFVQTSSRYYRTNCSG